MESKTGVAAEACVRLAALIEEHCGRVPPDGFDCRNVGTADCAEPFTLTWLSDERYVKTVLGNDNITGVIADCRLADRLERSGLTVIAVEDVLFSFFSLKNAWTRLHYTRVASVIDPTANVHPSAFVSEHNVRIGPGVIVGPNATVLEDVEIGADTEIFPNAVLGNQGYGFKRTSKGILRDWHDGKVIIGARVEIGAGACVAKGRSYRPTQIGDDTKLDSVCHVAHGCTVGKRTYLIAGAVLCGRVVIGDDVWVGPGAVIREGVKVGDGATVVMGAVVAENVPAGERWGGYFAVPFERFVDFNYRVRCGQ